MRKLVIKIIVASILLSFGGSVVLYFQHVARRLNAYNNSHRKKHIYMDMNYHGGVSFHTI